MKTLTLTVFQFNSFVKKIFDAEDFLSNIAIIGEITNFKISGDNAFFDLKDENAMVSCVKFGARDLNLKNGELVSVQGRVNFYIKSGRLNFLVNQVMSNGQGDLYQKFMMLKEKLEKEGYFRQEIKKEIPKFAKRIGVVTSETGAVIRDIINVSTRRNPNVNIRLYPVPVQGEGAAEKIADGIKFMNKNQLADVLILARGGGSLEDLWPFNEEIVAHAIYNSEIPVISAVGHETDFSISDFVADLRAPTPSAAAELAVPDVSKLQIDIEKYQNRLKLALSKKLDLMKLKYEKCINTRAFKNPYEKIENYYLTLDNYIKMITIGATNNYKENRHKFENIVSKLDSLSPLKTLVRGYS